MPLDKPPSRRWRPWLLPLYKQLLQYSGWPILVGPFRGEVGFEALYWIPFVHQLAHALNIPTSRLVPISRGGAAAWYGTPTGIELYAMRSVQDIRVENRLTYAQTAMMKQTAVSAFDQGVIRDAAETLGVGRKYLTLHPSWMYQTLAPFWEEQRGLGWLQRHIRVQDLPMPPLPGDVTLPPQFVAVRFYARSTYPLNEGTIAFARESIKQIAAKVPVVLLNSGLSVDDHVDIDFKTLPANVTRLTDLCELLPERNLVVQSAILARAMGFVGTYGGLAQLALRFRRPVVSVFTEWQGTALAHATFSRALGLAQGTPFHVLGIHELPMLQDVVPRVLQQAPPQPVETPILQPA